MGFERTRLVTIFLTAVALVASAWAALPVVAGETSSTEGASSASSAVQPSSTGQSQSGGDTDNGGQVVDQSSTQQPAGQQQGSVGAAGQGASPEPAPQGDGDADGDGRPEGDRARGDKRDKDKDKDEDKDEDKDKGDDGNGNGNGDGNDNGNDNGKGKGNGNGDGNGPPDDRGNDGEPGADKTTICHRTNSDTNPYEQITVADSALPAHRGHGDIVPAPSGGCPSAGENEPEDERVTICHVTESQSNPYVQITVPESALPAHREHGDIVPAPAGGCPSGSSDGANGDSSGAGNGADPSSGGRGEADRRDDELEILGRRGNTTGPADRSETAGVRTSQLRPAQAAAPYELRQGELPLTGFDALLYGLLGVGMTMMGAGLRLGPAAHAGRR